MPSCHYRGCDRIPDVPLGFKLPNSPDPRLAQGGTIYLCKKHKDSLLFVLDIKEGKEEDETNQGSR